MKALPITASKQTDFLNVRGWNFAENAGAAARVLLREGSVTGSIVADIRLVSGESVGENYGGEPLECTSALYVEVNSGTVRGAVYGD